MPNRLPLGTEVAPVTGSERDPTDYDSTGESITGETATAEVEVVAFEYDIVFDAGKWVAEDEELDDAPEVEDTTKRVRVVDPHSSGERIREDPQIENITRLVRASEVGFSDE